LPSHISSSSKVIIQSETTPVPQPKFLNSKNALNSKDLKLITDAGISKQLPWAIPKTTNIVWSCTDTQPLVSTASSFKDQFQHLRNIGTPQTVTHRLAMFAKNSSTTWNKFWSQYKYSNALRIMKQPHNHPKIFICHHCLQVYQKWLWCWTIITAYTQTIYYSKELYPIGYITL
jgi:hypothetical protein